MPVAESITPEFKTGDPVVVRVAFPIGHVRTPYYIRGKPGVVERLCGIYSNPEELAYARLNRPKQPLYRVRFVQCEVWPQYSGNREDTVDVEIYQSWLEAR
jgi:nitrile hydratase subunit beta